MTDAVHRSRAWKGFLVAGRAVVMITDDRDEHEGRFATIKELRGG
jgi:hypothetical protein